MHLSIFYWLPCCLVDLAVVLVRRGLPAGLSPGRKGRLWHLEYVGDA